MQNKVQNIVKQYVFCSRIMSLKLETDVPQFLCLHFCSILSIYFDNLLLAYRWNFNICIWKLGTSKTNFSIDVWTYNNHSKISLGFIVFAVVVVSWDRIFPFFHLMCAMKKWSSRLILNKYFVWKLIDFFKNLLPKKKMLAFEKFSRSSKFIAPESRTSEIFTRTF